MTERMPCGHTTDWLAWEPDHEELMRQVECIEGAGEPPLSEAEIEALAEVLVGHQR